MPRFDSRKSSRCYSARVPYCSTLQHSATHCNTLQRTATNRIRGGAVVVTTRRYHTAAHFDTLQHTATHCNTLQHTATHCNTLQHTATHCNTLQEKTLTAIENEKERVCVYFQGCAPSGFRFPALICGLFTCVHVHEIFRWQKIPLFALSPFRVGRHSYS